MGRRVWIALNAVSIVVAILAAAGWLTYPPPPGGVVVAYGGRPWYEPSRTTAGGGLALGPAASRAPGGTARMGSRAWRAAYPAILAVALVLPLSAATLWGLDEYRRRRALRRTGCRSCGYDLTGNVSGACPECGATVPSTTREAPCA